MACGWPAVAGSLEPSHGADGLADVLRSRGHVEQADAAYQEALEVLRSLDPPSLTRAICTTSAMSPSDAASLRRRRGFSSRAPNGTCLSARIAAGCPSASWVWPAWPRERETGVWPGTPVWGGRGDAGAPRNDAVGEQSGRLRTWSRRVRAPPAQDLAEAWAAGRELTLDEALAEARRLPEGRAALVGAPPDARTLTERERDVASLLARGLLATAT